MTTISIRGHEKAAFGRFGGPSWERLAPGGADTGGGVLRGRAGVDEATPAKTSDAWNPKPLSPLVQVQLRLHYHVLQVAVEAEAEAFAYQLHGAVVQKDLGGDAA